MASGSLGSRRQNHRCYGSAATEFVLRDGGSFLSTLNVVSGHFFVFAKAPLFALDPALAAGLLFFFDFLLFCVSFLLLHPLKMRAHFALYILDWGDFFRQCTDTFFIVFHPVSEPG